MSSKDPSFTFSLPASLAGYGAASSASIQNEVLQLFDECAPRLRRYVGSFGLGPDSTEDVVQEVFLQLFRHLHLGRSRANLRGWIFQVGHNLALKQRARTARRQRTEGTWDMSLDDRLVDPGADPEQQLADDRRGRRLRSVLLALPDRDRQCLYLRAEGLRYREIAKTLHISLGAVAKSLARAMTRLMNAYMRVRTMSLHESHPTDRHLLESLDDELPVSQRASLDEHLTGCGVCRHRREAMDRTATASSSIYGTLRASSQVPEEQSRARLKLRLSQAAEEANRPWNIGIGQALVLRRALACAGAFVVLAVAGMSISGTAVVAPSSVPLSASGQLPVPSITPGATWDVTAEDLCAGTRHTRAVTPSLRAEVVNAYGVDEMPADEYELDYLITPELGGATDARNLWPQAYATPVWNARVKDELESLLPRLVCSGQLDLETAQRDMAVDWIAAYKKYFNTSVPLQAHHGPALDDDDDVVYALADARPAPAVRLVSLAVLR